MSTAQTAFDDDTGEIGSRGPNTQTVSRQQPQHSENITQETGQERLPEQDDNHGAHPGGNTQPQNQARVPSPTPKRKRKRKPHKRPTRTRAYLKIGTLNMNGGGSNATKDKWENINQIVREEHLDVLVLQETHLTPDMMIDLCKRYPRIHIINSHDPEHTNAKGIAFVLNKHRTRWREAQAVEVKEARAIMIEMPWRQNESIHILGVYAPNETDEQTDFWKEVDDFFRTKSNKKPDIMMGDFNVVEDKIDRHPPHRDTASAVESLQELRMDHNLTDVWRNQNPNELTYTYTQFQNRTRKSLSRLDRIYMNTETIKNHYDWEFKHPGIKTDHKLVTVKIENPNMPYIGKGRWAMPNFVTENRALMKTIAEVGNKAHNEAMERPQEIQRIHEHFKEKTQNIIRKHTREAIPKLQKLRDNTQEEIKSMLKRAGNLQEGEAGAKYTELMTEIAGKEEELRTLSIQVHRNKRDEIAAKFWMEGETIGKPWINVNKNVTPRETIFRLKKPESNPTEYITRAEDMAEMAKNYHDNLQEMGTEQRRETRQPENTCLEEVKAKLNTEEREFMNEELTEEDIRRAIRELPNGKSPGLDGLTTELYKKLANDHEKQEGTQEEETGPLTFDIVKYLRRVDVPAI
ncbi:hypothetical protein CVT24_005290 [Panaeolus cyanescens]|uniref:Endonuclease/exonuclease/phosphatase domain-containing protein n=1 Tax=Panaeolus cyanescens TaxID=181874 RepID=A0A409WGP8_9AGAR|nr:hypothetical protein CVT24_005290 [Panaeolus cyanescens]